MSADTFGTPFQAVGDGPELAVSKCMMPMKRAARRSETGKRLPPRDRAVRLGVDMLPDEEVLALLLGAGPRGKSSTELAGLVLRETGGLAGMARSGAPRLAQITGVGDATAWRLTAAMELGRRVSLRASADRLRVCTPDAVAEAFAKRIGTLEHEEMWLVALDGRSGVRGVRKLSRGGRHGLVTSAREVLSAALAEAASGFILVHNHPSGSPEPSREDIVMTREVAEAAEVVGVPLVDHVIVTPSGDYCSLLEEGSLFT